ncbi:MAG: serine hydrolase [Candidatus Levybacteria bacterium]|nr:serine hydrolase [Candidatus Levybacteria bacterium]
MRKIKLIFLLVIIIISFSIYKLNEIIIPQINLEQTIKKTLAGAKGEYSIVIKNLKTGESYSIDNHKTDKVGSLYKLWIMATAFEQIQNGQLKEDEILSGDVAALNSEFGIDPDSADLTDGVVTFRVSEALKQMITISHNYAALLLSEKVKLSNVRSFLEKNGFKESVVKEDEPVSSPYDIALFLEKLYKGKLANKKYTNEMLDLLKQQQLNDKLPQYLPQGTVIAHKTGELDYLSHDAGIVYTKKGDYIIVVFSQSDFPAGAEERIAKISKAVYDYFTK